MLLGLLRVGPGDGLVVEGVVAKAAVQDPDPAVGQGPQGLLVGGALGAVAVVAGTRARRGGERAKRPPQQTERDERGLQQVRCGMPCERGQAGHGKRRRRDHLWGYSSLSWAESRMASASFCMRSVRMVPLAAAGTSVSCPAVRDGPCGPRRGGRAPAARPRRGWPTAPPARHLCGASTSTPWR